MKLNNIVDSIKRRFGKIMHSPPGYTLSIGGFVLDIVGFDFSIESCNFCNQYCDYIGSSHNDATIRVQGRVNRESLAQLEKLFEIHEPQTMVVDPNGLILEDAFIRSYNLSYEDMKSDTFVCDMEIVASSFRRM